MKRRSTILIVLILILLLFVFGIYNYMISIYEIIYKVSPEILYAGDKTELTVTAVPVNGLGGKALFREVEAVYTIVDGDNLVNISEKNIKKGILKFHAENKSGNVEIIAKSPYALLPSCINIRIYPVPLK